MAWTAPMTFTAFTGLTAAQLNTYLRDNMNETAPAKATTSGYHFVSTGPNQIAERAIASHIVQPQESTTSTSFTALATAGATVTVDTGSKVLWVVSVGSMHGTADRVTYASVEVSGATSIPPHESRALVNDGLPTMQYTQSSYLYMETGLTPGTNTFTMKYRVAVGTGYWSNRGLIVIAL